MPDANPLISDLPEHWASAIIEMRVQKEALMSCSMDELADMARRKLQPSRVQCDSLFCEVPGAYDASMKHVSYIELLHGRTLEFPRVGSIMHGLLHQDSCDEFAMAKVYPIERVSFGKALSKLDVQYRLSSVQQDELLATTHFISSGNHRLAAQYVLGMHPQAFVSSQPCTWY